MRTAALAFCHLTLAAWFAVQTSFAQESAAAPVIPDRLSTAVTQAFEEQQLVGLAVGIVADGRVVGVHFRGHEDRERDVEVDDATLFRWASISKPVTAIAAMQLVAAERLDLDRDVCALVPEFPAKPWPITMRQLLCHQGGIVHYTNGKVIVTERTYPRANPFEDVVVALDRFKESPLVAEPGTLYAYTTHGYMLAGAVVERAGGAPYWSQVRERIAVPAGLTTFQPDYQWIDLPRRVVGYRRLGERVIPSTNTDVSWKLAGGGFISNVGDLARFAAALLDDTLLSRELREQMWTNAATRDGKRTGYGLGFSVSSTDGVRLVAHSGSQEKTRTLMQLRPDERRAVVLMSNSEWATLGPIADAIWKALEPEKAD